MSIVIMRRMLPEISFFEVLLCFFVVMIHILSESIEFYDKGTAPSVIFFSISRLLTFAVPGFVISAGIKFAHKYEYSSFNYPGFMKGRIMKIYIPYIFCAVLYYLYFAFRHQYYTFDLVGLAETLLEGSIAAPFYFVIFMMQIYLLSPIFYVFYKGFPTAIGIILAAAVTLISLYFTNGSPYSNRILLNYFLYWIIGCYMGLDFRNKMAKLKQKKYYILIPGIVLTVIYIPFSYLQFLEVYSSFLTEIVKVAYCVVVSLTYLAFMPKAVGYFAEEFSAATFYVFLIHCLVIFETQHLLNTIGITSIPLRLIILILSTYTLSVLLSLGYVKVKKKLIGLDSDF